MREQARHKPLATGSRLRDGLGAARRTWQEAKRDHLSIVAAGVAFYGFLALFPACAAIVSIYGLVAEPQAVEQQLDASSDVMPEGVHDLLGAQLQRIAGASSSALGSGFVISVLLALWSANKGTRSVIEALNIAYDREEQRGVIRLNALSLSLTLAAVLGTVVAVFVVVAIPTLFHFVGLGGIARVAVDLLRWPLLLAVLIVGLGLLYRYGPSHETPPWRWVTPGSVLATLLWLGASVAFSIYVANFGSYDKTYGSLGAVAILLIWLYAGAYVVLLGAEFDAVLERAVTPR
jgi:membrane protein